MRLAVFIAAAALAACATTAGSLPSPRYADAASRGAFASFFAGRPTAAQVTQASEAWSRALGDSFACRVPTRQVIDAGLVGALEIAAMNAAASRGGEREIREGVRDYVGQLVRLAVDRRPAPSAQRCEALAAWAPRTAAQGREAVARARANGLMEDEYGLLLDLLSR
ncbi:MAG: hypothetical protein KJZ75_14030 [Hyphomonadaceae bacterium]|nr:hypothetical protein [Hyphomonadaceae bacterium]